MENFAKNAQLVHQVIDDLENSLIEERRKVGLLREAMLNVVMIVKNSRHRNVVIDHAAKALAEVEPGYQEMSSMDRARLRLYYRDSKKRD